MTLYLEKKSRVKIIDMKAALIILDINI